MRRFTLSLAVVVVLLVGVLASMGRSTTAQEATPPGMGGMATHPVVGGWRWDNEVGPMPADPAFPGIDISHAVFGADGTYVEVTWGGPGVGVWEATGERTADLLIFFKDINPDPNAFTAGLVTNQLTIDVDETGDAFTATGLLQVFDAGGNLLFEGPWNGSATRVTVDAPGTFGTPVAPLETPIAGTPAP